MDSKTIAFMAAEACEDKKAVNIELINITEVSSIAEWIVISEGLSDVQVRAISKSVEDKIDKEIKMKAIRKEGVNEAKWALLDYGGVIINIFQPKEREFYSLSSFWSNGEKYNYPELGN